MIRNLLSVKSWPRAVLNGTSYRIVAACFQVDILKSRLFLTVASLLLAGMALAPIVRAAVTPGKTVDFIHQVQPILKESCYSCHGPEKSKAGLRLDTKARAMKGGENGIVIVPGNGAKSSLVTRLTSRDEEERMPQKAEPLSAEKIKLVRDWIDQGAIWPEAVAGADPTKHWAFQPLAHPRPPRVTQKTWVRTPIDNFVLAKLEEKKIAPNGSASRRKLIRRAYLDLLGLPPKPEEVEAFAADSSANAYQNLIDRLLTSPHYGERWARHWLDAARFAESDGFEQDTDRKNAYWYRDFVIKALNEDMPYTQFVKWQLAGDEFAPEDPWALAATGFVGAEQFPTQLTEAEFEQARYDELDNMSGTTGTAMLGLTVGCARCHDHKFDPISNQEYYRLASTFTTTIRSEIDLDFNPQKYADAKKKFDAVHAPLVAARDLYESEKLPDHLAAWLKTRERDKNGKPRWIVLEPSEIKSKGGATFTPQSDGSLLASGKNPDSDTYTFITKTSWTNITAVRIEALAHPSLAKNGPGRADNGNFQFTDLRLTVARAEGEGKPAEVKLLNPKSTFDQGTNLAVTLVVDGDKKTGWAIDPQFGKDHAATFELEQSVGFEGGTVLTFTLDFQGNTRHAIGRPRISITTEPLPAVLDGETQLQSLVDVFELLNKTNAISELSNEQRAALIKWFRGKDPEWQRLDEAVQAHLKQAPEPEIKKVMVTSEGFKPMPHFADGRGFPHFYTNTYFLKRGDARQKGEVATQAFLRILQHAPEGEKHFQEQPPPGARTSYRRRALANWMTDPQYGAGELLARVIVNRVWHHHFGRGIVATPNDFGLQGERPTHPELLDWLATDFIQNGWQLKRLHKLIMTSATYMQSAESDEPRARVDKENRFLWHWPRRRLEAEPIRDLILSVSGQLDETIYGPGTLDQNMRRRSIYFFIKRSQLVPVLMLFDFPEPNVSVGGRVSTTIAPQALAMMNSPQVRSYARHFAERLKPEATNSLPGAINSAYQLALGRKPDTSELKDAAKFIGKQTESYNAAGKSAADDLALADFCQVLFGLNEFIYIE